MNIYNNMEKPPDYEGDEESPEAAANKGPKQTRSVNTDLMEKFQKLKRRREEITARSSTKRIKQIQNSVIEKVAEEFKKTNDLDALISHQVELPSDVFQTNDKPLSEDNDKDTSKDNDKVSESSPPAQTSSDKNQAWMDFKPFLDVNAHLQQAHREKYAPKTKLEKQIDKAIELGDFNTAEKLSDHLAVRELGKKVVDAIDAKRFTDKKKKEEEHLKAKQKKKLNWGFEHKQRWETKSNM